MLYLANKRILVGVTGSIAAYKSADLIRRLKEVKADVRVVMTENAKQFITPLTLQAVSGHPIHDNLFDVQAEAAMGHIELARWADMILIAPATADMIARLAQGFADDLLTTLCLATKAPIALAPAMNQGMWKQMVNQDNVHALKAKNCHILGPAEGSQACGDTGPGRMLEPTEILEKVSALFQTKLLAGKRVLITAGPTHEAIDPVRYIANESSGKMGYALAEAAREAGATVTLISGPSHLAKPAYIDTINVITACEMHQAAMKKATDCDIFLSVAAVCDYRVEQPALQKIHKTEDVMTLKLVKNPDIVQSVAALPHSPFVVGFAAETENVMAQAKAKRERKRLPMIIANEVGRGMGMSKDDNAVTVITEEQAITLPLAPKRKLARELIAIIAKEYKRTL